MTVTTEAQITLPAWEVEQGDYVYDATLDDWQYVEGVRHTQSEHFGWRVTLELALMPGMAPDAPRPRMVLAPAKEIQVWRV